MRAGCWRPAAARSSSTDPTGSGGRGHGGFRLQLRAAPADAGVRRHRLRRRRRAAGLVPRLPGHRLRRPRRCSPRRRASRRPTRSSSIGPTATWPRRRRPAPSTAHRDLRAHPRPEVRRPAARGGAAAPDVGYVGAMGSRRTHDDRMDRLRAAGLTDAELGRLSSPIGLDLGARTPEETAVSIAAEIIARRWGGGGRPLTETAAESTMTRTDPQVAGRVKGLLNSLLTPGSGGLKLRAPTEVRSSHASSRTLRIRTRNQRRPRRRTAGSAGGGGARHRRRAQPAADDEAAHRQPGVPGRHQRPGTASSDT